MRDTKRIILDAALHLFNTNGLVNVRLQHIADRAGLSVGNLAYHFPNKEAIVKALHAEITDRQHDLMANYRVVPLFDYLNLLIQDTYALQSCYIFFYLDTLEIVRAYPSIGDEHSASVNHQVNQLISIVDFNIARGALKQLESNEEITRLARHFWMTLDLWHVRNKVLSGAETELVAYLDDVWAVLKPHFTPMGLLEYKQMRALNNSKAADDNHGT